MKNQSERKPGRVTARIRASVEAVRERRRRKAAAAEKLRPFTVLPTRPGSLLHL